MSSSSSSSNNPANAGEMADGAYIDVLVPGTATAPSSAASTVVLHDFSSCTTKFSGLIQGGGLVYSVTTSVPTLTVSTPNLVLGAGLQEYVATQLFLVPKLHASNRLTQVSASDLEIVIEHAPAAAASGSSSSSSGGVKRVFLCAVVSADPSVEPDPAGGGKAVASKPAAASSPALPPGDDATSKLIGQDTALLAFLRNINTSGGAAAAPMRANNAKLLPLDTHLTFPGVGTCMSYPDRKGNTVLLLGDPLLAGPELVSRLFAVVAAAAPVFGNFDLAQKDGALPTLVAFRSNTTSVPTVSLTGGADAAMAVEDGGEGGDGGGGEDDEGEEDVAEGFEQKTGKKRRRGGAARSRPTATTVWMLVTAMVIVVALLVPVWVYGPRAYAFAVARTAGANPSSVSPSPLDINVGIRWVKIGLAIAAAAAATLFATGMSAGSGNASVVVAVTGATLLLALAVLLASVHYDISVRTASVVRGLPGVRQDTLADWQRWDYVNNQPLPWWVPQTTWITSWWRK